MLAFYALSAPRHCMMAALSAKSMLNMHNAARRAREGELCLRFEAMKRKNPSQVSIRNASH